MYACISQDKTARAHARQRPGDSISALIADVSDILIFRKRGSRHRSPHQSSLWRHFCGVILKREKRKFFTIDYAYVDLQFLKLSLRYVPCNTINSPPRSTSGFDGEIRLRARRAYCRRECFRLIDLSYKPAKQGRSSVKGRK